MSTYTVEYGGERIDQLAKKLLQTEKFGTTEALLVSNPGLAARSPGGIVPADTVIAVPEDFRPVVVEQDVLAWE